MQGRTEATVCRKLIGCLNERMVAEAVQSLHREGHDVIVVDPRETAAAGARQWPVGVSAAVRAPARMPPGSQNEEELTL
jgi:hypothetical protein